MKRLRQRRRDRTPSRAALLAQRALLVALALLATVVGLRLVVDQLRPVPDDAKGVLAAASGVDDYAYRIETVRKTTVKGVALEQGSLRYGYLDERRNRYQLTFRNVSFNDLELVSDGKRTIARLGEAQEYAELPKQVPAGQLAPPLAEEIAKARPKLLSDDGAVFNRRAWVLSFRPDARIVRQLLLADGLDLDSKPLYKRDLAQIKRGRFTARWARAWVTYKERDLLMVDVRIDVNGGAEYRFLVLPSRLDRDLLADLKLKPAA